MNYIGYRYGARFSHSYDTLEEAIRMATAAANNGDAAYECIENDDGTIALDKTALGAAIDKQNAIWDAADAVRVVP